MVFILKQGSAAMLHLNGLVQGVWKYFSASVQTWKLKMGFTTSWAIRNIFTQFLHF